MLETVRWITAAGRILDHATATIPLLPGKVRLIDQTRLPLSLEYVELDSAEAMRDAIRRLVVRGAPAIGCAAALGLAAELQHSPAGAGAAFLDEARRTADRLASARPTAVNLAWALRRCMAALQDAAARGATVADLKVTAVREGLEILAEDIRLCRSIGEHGAPLIREGMGVLTHCNAGALATGDYGTALAAMYTAHQAGRQFTVYSGETRPLLQGSRLTAWELRQAGINVVTLCDSAAGALMQAGKIQTAIVGADRVAANGDFANKIGTYALAVLARYHNIPFYVAMPYSTVDAATPTGAAIPIEQRDPEEVRRFAGVQTTPEGAAALNPAFDVTPHALVTGYITERGILQPPITPAAP